MAWAGGKVILCGEHAVVHGGDAIVLGLNRGVVATASRAPEWRLVRCGQALAADDATLDALRLVAGHLGCGPIGVELEVTMPLGVGLGGSAAMAVAIARAIGELRGAPLSNVEAFAAAQIWEQVFHGNPSGVDAAAASYGGCLLYNRQKFALDVERGRAPTRLTLARPLRIAVAVAGPPSLTKAMVEQVAHFRQRDAAAFSRTLCEIQSVVDQSRRCVESGKLEELGALLCQNHLLLSQWGLSTPEIERARSLAIANGALGSKLTGAGGGGCVIALCAEQTLPLVLDAWARSGFRALSTTVDPNV